MNILVTGANGFIGKALCSALDRTNHQVIRAVRTATAPWDVAIGDLGNKTDWSSALNHDTDAVVHLAAQVPLTDNPTTIELDQYETVNTFSTARLARQCVQSGVKRFIFISTIKVFGQGRIEPYQSSDKVFPTDAYTNSKWQAEQTLREIASESGMEVVVLRPPLVYGPGVRGNFMQLLRAIDQRRLLPLGAIQNRRSFIYLGNLVDAICLCLVHPKAAGKTYLVSDGEDLSTPDLVQRISVALDYKPLLIPIPTSWIRWFGNLLGKEAAVDRLLESLTLDNSHIRNELGWLPPYTMEEGLRVTAEWYSRHKRDE